MKMVFISKKRETLLFLITNLLVNGEDIFQTIPETLILPETGEKGRGKKTGHRRPPVHDLQTALWQLLVLNGQTGPESGSTSFKTRFFGKLPGANGLTN